MSNKEFPSIWSGWRLIDVPEASGGSEARASRRLALKRRSQCCVLQLVKKTHPELIRGEPDVGVSAEIVNSWLDSIHKTDGATGYDIRDQVNFLALGLERGRNVLGWSVEVPSPYQVVHQEAAPFTPGLFDELNDYRDWHRAILDNLQASHVEALLQPPRKEGGRRSADPERISWGLFLFFAVTQDALVDLVYLSALPVFSRTLTIHEGQAWLELFTTTPDAFGGKLPPRFRWMPGPASLAALMQHLQRFGHPECKQHDESKRFTLEAWRHFARALGVKPLALTACLSQVATAAKLYVPPYLVNSLSGRHRGTSLEQDRWQQLVLGGRIHRAVKKAEEEQVSVNAGTPPTSLKSRALAVTPNVSQDWLKSLQQQLNKSRSEKRLKFSEVSALLDAGGLSGYGSAEQN